MTAVNTLICMSVYRSAALVHDLILRELDESHSIVLQARQSLTALSCKHREQEQQGRVVEKKK